MAASRWTSPHRLMAIAVAVLVIAALVVAVNRAMPGPGVIAGATSASPQREAAPLSDSARSPVQATQPASRPKDRVVDLSALLQAPGSDLRGSVNTARAAVSSGGRLYARALVRPCGMLAVLTAPRIAGVVGPQPPQVNGDNALYAQAVQQRQSWEAGCGQMLRTELVAAANPRVSDGGERDPLLALADGTGAEDAASRKARLTAIMDRPDGLLIDEARDELLQRTDAGYRFDGRLYATEDEQRLVDAALRLLPCEFGMVCDGRDAFVWLGCVQGEGCYASRQDQVLAGAARGNAARMAEIIALRDQLADAIRRHAVDRF